MPFVERNWKGEIVGLFAVAQSGSAEEFLPENDQEVRTYRNAHPTPELQPLTPDEIRQWRDDSNALQREHEALRNAIWAFNAGFNELENTLSALLYSALNITKSRVAYAIYFSSTGFDARKNIVNDVIRELIRENSELGPLEELWDTVSKKIEDPRKMRNTIAHGHPITFSIRGKNHARLAPPAFDIKRASLLNTKKTIPGLTSGEIFKGAKKIKWLIDRIDETNQIFSVFYEDGNPTIQEKFHTLKTNVTMKDDH